MYADMLFLQVYILIMVKLKYWEINDDKSGGRIINKTRLACPARRVVVKQLQSNQLLITDK